jgi:hypothetical protein
MFAVNSRYNGLPVLTRASTDGTELLYVARRLLPDPDKLVQIGTYAVGPADRLDLIAAAEYGDPEQAWRIADAARVLDPDELTTTPGRVLLITLPAGVTGGSGG